MAATAVPVVFAADRGYLPHLATAMFSLLENNRARNFSIAILSSDISAQDFDVLRRIAQPYAAGLVLHRVPASAFTRFPLTYHLTRETYYRLLIPETLPDDRCLYLDSDLLVLGDIGRLLEQPLEDALLAAVPDAPGERHLDGMRRDVPYCNAGVLLLNLRKWREERFADAVADYILAHRESLKFPDQDGINAVANGRCKVLPGQFNHQSYRFARGRAVASGDRTEPLIVHFTGSSKPWQLANRHPYKKAYWQYRNRTPFRAHACDDFTVARYLWNLIPATARPPLRRMLRR